MPLNAENTEQLTYFVEKLVDSFQADWHVSTDRTVFPLPT